MKQVVGVSVQLALVSAIASIGLGCGGDDDAGAGVETPAARFCDSLSGSIAECAEPGMCLQALVDDCSSLAGIINDSFLEAGATCIQSMEPVDVCLATAIGEAEPTDAHRAFAAAFCTECAFGIAGCEEQFFGGSGETALAGNVILPFGDAAVDALRTECATGFGCAASFPSCAQRVLIEQGVPERTIQCLIGQLTSGESRDEFRGCLPSLPDGGPGGGDDAGGTTMDAGMDETDAGMPSEDAGVVCAPAETCGDARDNDCNGLVDDGCGGYRVTSMSHELGTYGGGGFAGPSFALPCDPDEVMVGLAGRAGTRVDRVAPWCAQLGSDGRVASMRVSAGSAGGTGGTAFDDVCPGEASAIVGVHGRAGSDVDAIGVTCADVREWVGGTADTFDLAPHGGTGGGAFRAMCPRGFVLTEIHGRAGGLVDELSGICHAVTR